MRFRSIVDTETGEILSLGDSSERVREILGEPDFILTSGITETYHFYESPPTDKIGAHWPNPYLSLSFPLDIDYGLMTIHIGPDNERFELQMTIDDVRNEFEAFSSSGYIRSYDRNSNLVTNFEVDPAYSISVSIQSERIFMITKMLW